MAKKRQFYPIFVICFPPISPPLFEFPQWGKKNTGRAGATWEIFREIEFRREISENSATLLQNAFFLSGLLRSMYIKQKNQKTVFFFRVYNVINAKEMGISRTDDMTIVLSSPLFKVFITCKLCEKTSAEFLS